MKATNARVKQSYNFLLEACLYATVVVPDSNDFCLSENSDILSLFSSSTTITRIMLLLKNFIFFGLVLMPKIIPNKIRFFLRDFDKKNIRMVSKA